MYFCQKVIAKVDRLFYIPVSKPEMQFRMFWAHSRSVSLASRHTGVPAMFTTWEEDENQRDMRDKRSRCFLNRRPMLTLKVHLVSLKVHLVTLKG